MLAALVERLDRPVTFVVGKGGVGKTTTAGALALALADGGQQTRLVSTDPAHSIADLFLHPLPEGAGVSPCSHRLILEELDAEAVARGRLGSLEPALRQIIERGTYLDEEDAATLVGGAIPGLDEVGAALRLVALAGGTERVVVDTAPTGHTLRLLDIEATVLTWIEVFDAMAAKADAVASALLRASFRLEGEAELDRLADEMAAFTSMLAHSDFLVVTGPGSVVRAETGRLVDALLDRGLRIASTVAADRPGAEADVLVSVRPGIAGCAALREWWAEAGELPARVARPAPTAGRPQAARRTDPVGPIPAPLDRGLVAFAGKGGVGKTTCAAALAVRVAQDGPVTLIGADPAGSLADVVAGEVAGLTVVEMDAETELARLRDRFQEEVHYAFEAMGLDHAARLDREVMESLWGAAPPGLDELVAVSRLAGDTEAGTGRMVLDTAPTGHFLRLMAMPELALDWVHRIMRVLLRYQAMGGVDAPAGALLRLAKQLRALRARLSDASRTSIVVVTVDEPLVRAETARLVTRLRERHLPVGAVLVNRFDGEPGTAPHEGIPADVPVLRAPRTSEPVGRDALLAFSRTWTQTP
jgi:arsenite/tail-anchored protein-transporting ATPase